MRQAPTPAGHGILPKNLPVQLRIHDTGHLRRMRQTLCAQKINDPSGPRLRIADEGGVIHFEQADARMLAQLFEHAEGVFLLRSLQVVALGLGASIVPHRALALYLQRRRLQKVPLRPRFARELAVVTRKSNYPRPHVEQFVRSILF